MNVWLILLYRMFISCCTYLFIFFCPIYFFTKKFIFFNDYISVNLINIRMSLYVFWLRNGPSIKHVLNWWSDGEGLSKMRTAAYKGKVVPLLMCTYALTLSLFMFLAIHLFCSALFYLYLQKFNLTFIKKRCVRQKRLFFSNEINFCRHIK